MLRIINYIKSIFARHKHKQVPDNIASIFFNAFDKARKTQKPKVR
jgi:hypothetical protein